MGERPVIGFLTDFGLDGAAAICRGVMLSIARDAQIVDICHTLPKYAIAEGAYLLRSAVPWLPIGVHVAVVDPGVGTDRRPIGLRTARGDVLLGPDNGLLLPAAERLGGITDQRLLANRAWMLPATSSTFHGRDIFAPIGAHLALGKAFVDVGPTVAPDGLVRLDLPTATVEAGRLATGIAYIDSFGNLRLAGTVADLTTALGPIEPGAILELELELDGARERASWRRTFGEAAIGELIAYEDSSGDLAIAVSSGNAAVRLGIARGARIGIRRA